MISIQQVSKSFGERTLFEPFDFDMPNKGLIALVGHSGSGKTTLLNMLAGLDFNYQGTVLFEGNKLSEMSEDQLADFRLKNTGYVFQNFNLFNLETVFENVLLPLSAVSNSTNRIMRRRVNDILKLLGIEKLKNKNVNKLSGGEKQRVSIARAIINKPKLVLCDEPTGALDETNSKQIFEILKSISKTTLVVVATHDFISIKNKADYILKIENKKINIFKNSNEEKNDSKFLLVEGKKIEKPTLPISFKIKHAINKNKSKKWRSVIINLMLSLSLTGVGLSIIISDSVSSKVNEAFSDILNGNQIVMSSKNNVSNTFSNYYTANDEVINSLTEKYSDNIEDVGANYLVNFEDFFKDRNEFSVVSNNKRFVISSLSARNINDFEWFESNLSDVYYPVEPTKLNDDQVILGLSFQDMSNLCFALQIQRNYTSLGHYIYENGLYLVLNVKNNQWQYDDEQIFEIVAVRESSKSNIVHTNSLWNKIVFEEMMRLPGDDDSSHDYPWEMYKLYFLKTKEDSSIFLNKVFYDEQFEDYVFERTNHSYNPILCEVNQNCEENRIFIFSVDKNFVSPSIIEKIKMIEPRIENYFFTSQFGYSSFASNIFSGFSKNLFVSFSDDLIDQAIDADTSLSSDNNLTLDLPPGVVQGNYLNSLNNGVRYSTKIDKIVSGRMPKNLNEIVISSGLAKSLYGSTDCLGIYLKIASEISETNINSKILKEYGKTKLLVVGITDEENNYMYHQNDWTISFFRDKLGISNFFLIPTGVVFEFDENIDSLSIASRLSKLFKNYNFESPLALLNENISETLEYANTILIAFSILSIVISILLLSTIILLSVIESKEEIKLFKYLGFKYKDINSTFVYQGLMQGLLAFLFSSAEIVLADQLISFFLGDYLNLSFTFSINFKPILVTLLIATIMPIIVSKIMVFLLNIKAKSAKS